MATKVPQTLAQQFAALFTGAGAARDVWFDADLYNTSAGNVTAFVDHNDPTHLWNVTDTIANPVADAELNSALSVTGNGTPYATSSRALANWSFLHQTAMTIVHVHVKTSDSLGILFSTSTNPGGGDGIDTYTSALDTYTSRALNVLGAVPPVTTGWANGGYVLRIQHAPSSYDLRRNGVSLSSGAYGGAPGALPAAYPFSLGRSGGFSFIGRWAATYVFHRSLTAGDLTTVSAFTTAKYGVAV